MRSLYDTTSSDKHLAVPSMKRLGSLRKRPFFHNIRVQLNDQLKNLDGRVEIQQGIVSEFHDIFRRRAEIESNYSKELDKLAKLITNRHKEHKQRRDGWQIFSSLQLWEQLVNHTKKTSRDHAALSDIYTCHIVQRCNQINEDLQRIYKKCREIGYEIHEEVLKVLHELHTAMKTHHNYQTEFRQAENKLQMLEKQRSKLMASVPPEKQEKHRKLRQLEKEHSKRRAKYDDARLKATKARNEYLLCMEAANSSIQRYFVEDLSDIIDCMDFGFHQSLNRAVMMHSNGLDQVRRSLQQEIDALGKSCAGLDSRLDKQKFFEYNNTAFMIPKKFEYSPARRDESESLVQKPMLDELEMRKQKLKDRIGSLNLEREEVGKSMDSAEKSLQDIVGCSDWDTTRFFIEEDRNAHKEPEAIVQKQKADRQEVEDFYVAKFREYVLNSNRVARLQAKYEHIRVTLGDQPSQSQDGGLTLTRRLHAGKRRRIGKTPRQGAPKLFGGSLEEYLEEMNVDIPQVIKSCVRVINLFGLHHHGIFRVSGSQVDIAHIRDAFERGDDPLADVTDANDMNSVAGVLKLYLRELREPIFPIQYFEHFMELAQLESKHEFVVKVRDMVKTWPRPIFVVMRYIFAFLNHLSEFSDENMMDPYNLAICFGPTLVPVPDHKDQVQYQNLVNELIKNFIIFHEDIFPTNVPGTAYEKYLTDDIYPDEPPIEDSPTDISRDDELDDGSTYIDDDSVFREDGERDDPISLDLFGKSEAICAQALYDFNARSSREVDFRKGDSISLFKQVSGDWWRGSVNGKEGLIPDKYIMLTMRGEDEITRERMESCRSENESRHRSASVSAASTLPFDQTSKSRTSSSSSQETAPSGPNRAPRGHSAHASSSSPGSSGRKNVTSTIDKPQISPNLEYEQRTARSLTGSLSSPGSSSQRTSKTLSTAQAIALAASTATTPMFQQTSAQSSGSRTASSTVINVTGEQRKHSSNSTKDGHIKPPLKFQEEDMNSIRLGSSNNTLIGNTHIIKVSGPVTNLDETVLSAVGMDGSLMASTISENSTTSTASASSSTAPGMETRETGMVPRSRLPLSPSMEARLSDDTSASQDSLVSTGSNQELQTQLDSTLAEVEAITIELEKQKLPSNGNDKQRSPMSQASNIEVNPSTSPTQQQAPPKPRRLSKDAMELQPHQRRSSEQGDGGGKALESEGQRKNSEDTGARARNPVKKSTPHIDKAPKVTPRSNVTAKNDSGSSKPLLITQSSWASRDQGINCKSATASAKVLQSKKATSPKQSQSHSPTNDTQNTKSNEGQAQLSAVVNRKASLASQQNDNPNNGDIRSDSNNRSVWERRASSQSTTTASSLADQNIGQPLYNMSASVEGSQQIGGVGPNPVSLAFQLQRGGFRNNRDFWEQRGAMRQKQTPDLVIDLPVSSLSTSPTRTQSSSPPSSASSASVSSANTAAVAPLPRPRKSISPSNNPAANIDSDEKNQARGNTGKPSAKPRKL